MLLEIRRIKSLAVILVLRGFKIFNKNSYMQKKLDKSQRISWNQTIARTSRPFLEPTELDPTQAVRINFN